MRKLLFFYLILSYSIGLPSIFVLTLAFIRSQAKLFLYLLFFIAIITLHLIYLTYIGAPFWFSYYDTLIFCILENCMIITLPFLFHEWLMVPRRQMLNLIFSGLFLTSLVLVAAPFFLRMPLRGINLEVLPGFKISRALLGLTLLYVIVITICRFQSLKNLKDRFFIAATVICLLLASSQIFITAFQISPYNVIGFAAIYFIWNLLLLKYCCEGLLVTPPADNSVKETIGNLKLTEREKEILLLLVEGHSSQKIGAQLFISETTVKTHIKNIYRKLEVNNRVQLFNLLKDDGYKVS